MVKAIRPIPPAVRDAQARASDPKASTFVSANAGSGKTHVLVQRVIRLLLSGVPPEKILCITFTKAAAANMAERVFTTLGHWVTLDDTALDTAIREAGIVHPSASLRREARKLFACALETPGGLKVQTIHALCTRLLQQFPFEANVPARFAVLDDRDQNEMMERANLAVFLEASRIPDSPIGRALRTAMASAADVTFKDVVREACLSRDHFMGWTDAAGSAAAAAAQMSAALGVSSDIRIEDVEREIVDGPNLQRSSWKEMATLLDTSSKADQKQAERLRAALTFTGAAQVDEYLGVFLTDDRAPRASVVTNNFIKKNAVAGHRFEAEVDRLGPLIERRRAVVARDRTEALIHIATAAAAHYRREKLERGLLDYDDLIDKTLAMLDRVSSGWVHYKLDRGVDHVLIDEAQDTSPRQWDIVAHIISEFTSGAGARDGLVRTVFAVGDEKQSIFSFQGAAPREFDLRRRELKRRFEEAGLKFDPVSFTYSFRSGPVILHSVDHVFREQEIFRSIHAVENGYPIHNAMADAGPQPDRAVGSRGRGRPPGHRGLARAVRRRRGDQPRGKTRAAHPDRDQAPRQQRHHDRQRRRAAAIALRRYADPGAAARQRVRRGDPGAEARQHSGRRRRPAEADRAHRDHRPDEPRRRAAAAAGRPRARGGAEEPAVRPHRRRSVQAGVSAPRHAARGAGRAGADR
ncbi:double-strand break repair helicase AddA [Bradyrhizobium sp. JR3.5]